MRPELYSADSLATFLRRKTIATLPEIKEALGTAVDRTAFRKLSALHYRASYSHRGRYYTLDELTPFDSSGLWSFNSVRFSVHGNLVNTAAALVAASNAGYFADELDDLLHVETKDCLRHLLQQGRLGREIVAARLLYCSPDASRRRAQIVARQVAVRPTPSMPSGPVPELQATIILFVGLLNEKQRRLFAGLESLKLGTGGDSLIAQTLGLDPETVAKGRRELLKGEGLEGRIRRAGAGRKPVEKKHQRSSRASRNS